MTTIMYVSAILAVVIILTIIGVLSRYRRCKPNQVLVVYGKTGGKRNRRNYIMVERHSSCLLFKAMMFCQWSLCK